MKKLKLLFVSRAYPPITGGIENQNFEISQAFPKITFTKTIANKYGKMFLPIFLPYVFLRLFFISSKYDVILFGDGVLSPIGAVLKFFHPRKKFVSIIHGLDITYAYKKSWLAKIFKIINIPAHKKLDKLIMVGNETIAQAVKMGIDRNKCVFIPNGVDPDKFYEKHSKEELEKLLNQDLKNNKIILRVGRFVKHKGVAWFISNVMPILPENYFFIAIGKIVSSQTAGDENYFEEIKKVIKEKDLKNRVKLLPNISQENLKILYNTCDLYISPNISVPGSMEGFGLTVLEVASCGKVVLASELEGLKDAIEDGKNGFLTEPENAQRWAKKIQALMADDDFREKFGARAKEYVQKNFYWNKIAERYVKEMEKLLK